MSIHVFRDLLDKQLLDERDCKMGRIDGLVGRVRDDGPPVIEQLELGMTRVGERLSTRIGRWVEAASRRFGVRRTPRYLIAWTKVKSVDDRQVRVMVDSEREASNDWEWWLRTNVIDRIPGGKPDEEDK
jgi:hypothetical protein